ncbi:metalloregulator ArsR/SmtB family transcription factor [Nocardia sp. SYP-A9097]|uniref:ArsR/SmtB family transcription factor n=1 Tax=Nocardia sp. SYP-A9097 TaxID=2663237 RepID=UPI00129ACFA3|nr:metalloregulator ArsR/SmtB family transcription factor [Nocardia sp. SYP-A9097]MRH90052.1 metalloregulator ArsR/SmtB family transcription factor [Nocardia sp. SYP-A9097]
MEHSPAKIFDALGDPVRRFILELVGAGELPAGSIVAAVQAFTSISQPGVSQHLKVLRDAGLLGVRAEGTRRIYAIDPEATRAARSWLAALGEQPFAQSLDALATEIARGKRERRDDRRGTTARPA